MSIEDAIVDAVRLEIRSVVREEIRAAMHETAGDRLAKTKPASVDGVLTIQEVADLLRMRPNTIRIWIRDGRMKAVAVGGGKRREYRIHRCEVDRMLNTPEPTPDDPDKQAARILAFSRSRLG